MGKRSQALGAVLGCQLGGGRGRGRTAGAGKHVPTLLRSSCRPTFCAAPRDGGPATALVASRGALPSPAASAGPSAPFLYTLVPTCPQTGLPMTGLAVLAGEWRLNSEDRALLNSQARPSSMLACHVLQPTSALARHRLQAQTRSRSAIVVGDITARSRLHCLPACSSCRGRCAQQPVPPTSCAFTTSSTLASPLRSCACAGGLRRLPRPRRTRRGHHSAAARRPQQGRSLH